MQWFFHGFTPVVLVYDIDLRIHSATVWGGTTEYVCKVHFYMNSVHLGMRAPNLV